MSVKLASTTIKTEEDVVEARRQARDIAAKLGFDANDQTRMATAVSEIARNAYHYAAGGVAEFLVASLGPGRGVDCRRARDPGNRTAGEDVPTRQLPPIAPLLSLPPWCRSRGRPQRWWRALLPARRTPKG